MRTHHLASALSTALVVLGSQIASAQVSPYYLFDGYGDGRHAWVAQNGHLVNSFNRLGDGFAPAIGGTIRLADLRAGYVAYEHALDGTVLGTLATPNIGFWDGTTDGARNYGTNINNQVYAAGLDWSNPQVLFNAAAATLGVTYDAGHNSLWTTSSTGNSGIGTLFQYSMTGTLLSSFTANVGRSNGWISALAYDAADQSLWFSTYDERAQLWQYSTSGTELQHYSLAGTQGYLAGGEFAEVQGTPEPAGLVLMGTGLLGIAAMVRRKRSA